MFIRALTLAAALALPRLAPAQTTWHVDPTCGDDTWTGLTAVCMQPDGPKRTIQAAMALAASGDEVLLADGDYHQSLTTESINFAGRDIVLRSRNGPEKCIIRLNTIRPGIVLEGGKTVAATVQGIRFDGADFAGGGIVLQDAAITVADCIFFRCSRGNGDHGLGGGIYGERATIVIIDSEFVENGTTENCYNYGGAVGVHDSEVAIYASRFIRNQPLAAPCAGVYEVAGGALYGLRSSFLIEDSNFEDNAASFGGAISAEEVELLRCRFTENTAFGVQDLLSAWGGAVAAARVRAQDCVFEANLAVVRDVSGTTASGGAISGTEVDLLQCVFYSNQTRSDGCDPSYSYSSRGAVSAGDARVINCSFFGNSAGCSTGAIGAGTIVVRGSIVRSSSPDELSAHTSADVTYSNIHGGYPGEGNIDADPLFLDPAAGDFRLRPGSPCIDAGDSSAVPAGITLDLAGLPRFRDDPRTPDTGKGPAPIVDMGAYEFQPPCDADCDADGELTFFDFLCFQNLFAAMDPAADCDGDTRFTFFDFLCFQNAFAAGCP